MCIFFRFIWIAFFFFFFYLSQVWSSLFLRCFGHFLRNSFVCFAIYNFFSFSQDSSELLSLPGFLLFWVLFCCWAPPVNFSIALFQADGYGGKLLPPPDGQSGILFTFLFCQRSNQTVWSMNEGAPSLCNATCESLLLVFFQFNLFLIYFNSYVGYFFLT